MKRDLIVLTNADLPALRRALTPAQFGDLAELPPELEWLANLTNPKTRRAYKIDLEEFIAFAGLGGIAELRSVTRAHVIAWRKDRLENLCKSVMREYAVDARRVAFVHQVDAKHESDRQSLFGRKLGQQRMIGAARTVMTPSSSAQKLKLWLTPTSGPKACIRARLPISPEVST